MKEIIDDSVELLIAYSQKIQPNFPPMTLKELIESHQSLRESNKIKHHEFLSMVKKATDIRVNQIINEDYVRWDALSKMTLEEIAKNIS